MEEKNLLKIALISSVVGLFVLYIIADSVSVDEKTISQLEENDFTSVRGSITRITQKENVTFLDVSQTNKLSVVLFKPDYLDLKQGDFIEAIGTTKIYDNKMELVANEVRKI